MAQIAIIGTEGAGKTVFLSTLAMRYRVRVAGRPWLEVRNAETQRHVTRAWDALKRQDWPPSTPAGTLSQLEWRLHTSSGEPHAVSVCDPAGQDFRALFDSTTPPTAIQQRLRLLLDTANVVLFLVNLRDVIDSNEQAQVDDVEIPIKLALDAIVRRGASAALVLTQYDMLTDRLRLVGVDARDPLAAVTRYLPQVVGALHRAPPGRMHVCSVAAVAQTVSVVADDGSIARRPRIDFTSEGFESLLAWVEEVLYRQAHPLRASSQAAKKQISKTAAPAGQALAQAWTKVRGGVARSWSATVRSVRSGLARTPFRRRVVCVLALLGFLLPFARDAVSDIPGGILIFGYSFDADPVPVIAAEAALVCLLTCTWLAARESSGSALLRAKCAVLAVCGLALVKQSATRAAEPGVGLALVTCCLLIALGDEVVTITRRPAVPGQSAALVTVGRTLIPIMLIAALALAWQSFF